MGGVLMNESITRAAGAAHGQEQTAEQLETLIREAGRTPRQRTTLYGALNRHAGAGGLTNPTTKQTATAAE
jgi:FO synthase